MIEPGSEPIPIREDADFRRYTRRVALDGTFVLQPGATVHGITRERITLAPRISAGCSRDAAASRASA